MLSKTRILEAFYIFKLFKYEHAYFNMCILILYDKLEEKWLNRLVTFDKNHEHLYTFKRKILHRVVIFEYNRWRLRN